MFSILENVKGLTALKGGKYQTSILFALSSIHARGTEKESEEQAYEFHHTVINTKNHGLPHSRPRWYCVGIREDIFQGDKSDFLFPKPIPCQPIGDFLQKAVGQTAVGLPTELPPPSQANLTKARKRLVAAGVNP